MDKIKFIVFDLGGVIFSSSGASYEEREKLAKNLGIGKEDLHRVWFEKKDLLITGKMNWENYLKEIINLSGKNISLDYLKKELIQNNYINEEMINLLKKLNENYVLVVLNNEIKELNEYRINKFNLKEYFKFILSSCDLGVAKPNEKIYRILLDKLKANPKEIIFIDDRIENLPPAKKLGIKTHLFENKEKLIVWFKNIGVDNYN